MKKHNKMSFKHGLGNEIQAIRWKKFCQLLANAKEEVNALSPNEVVRAWINNKSAETDHLSTDGKDLFSYKLKIGYTENEKKVVIDYTAKSNKFVSMTTSKHVGLAKQVVRHNLYLKGGNKNEE